MRWLPLYILVCSVAMVSKQSKSFCFIWPGSGLWRALSSRASTFVQVESSMPRDIARGIASVKRFVRQHSIKGVHGTLIELIECSNRLHTAIEVQALAATLFLQCLHRETSPALALCRCSQLPLSWEAADSQSRHEVYAIMRCPGICIHDVYAEGKITCLSMYCTHGDHWGQQAFSIAHAREGQAQHIHSLFP